MGAIMSLLTIAYFFLTRNQFHSPSLLFFVVNAVFVIAFAFGAIYLSFAISDNLGIPRKERSEFALIWVIEWSVVGAFALRRIFKR
jgi:hypothetical protein